MAEDDAAEQIPLLPLSSSPSHLEGFAEPGSTVTAGNVPITKITFDKNGAGFVCGFADGHFKVFPDEIDVFVEPGVPINDIIWVGREIFVCTEAGQIWRWDWSSLKLFAELDIPILSLAVSPDGRYIVSGSDDGLIQPRDFIEGLLVAETTENFHTGPVASLQFTSQRQTVLLISGSWDGTIKCWSWEKLSTGKQALLWSVTTRLDQVTSVEISGSRLAAAGQAGLELLDMGAVTKKPPAEGLFYPAENYFLVHFVQDILMIASRDGTFQLLNLDSKTFEEFSLGRHFGRITSVATSPDKSTILSSGSDGVIKAWQANAVLDHGLPEAARSPPQKRAKPTVSKLSSRGSVETLLKSSGTEITCTEVESYARGCVSISGRADGTLTICQSFLESDGDALRQYFHLNHAEEPIGNPEITEVSVSPNCNFLISVTDHDLQLWIFNPTIKKPPERFRRIATPFEICSMCFSADEKYLVLGTNTGKLIQRLLLTTEMVMQLDVLEAEEPQCRVTACAFSPSGEYLAAATEVGRIMVWKCTNNRIEPGWKPYSFGEDWNLEIHSLAFCDVEEEAPFEFLGAGADDGVLHVWRIGSRTARRVPWKTKEPPEVTGLKIRAYHDGDAEPIINVKFTSDSVVGSSETTTKYWRFSRAALQEESKHSLFEKKIFDNKLASFALRQKKSSDDDALEERIPWQKLSFPGTLDSVQAHEKSIVFVVRENRSRDIVIEQISCVPALFWNKQIIVAPLTKERTSPVLWFARRKGSVNAIKRIVQDATECVLYVTNENDQVAFHFAVKCGDPEMIEYTSNHGVLNSHRDAFGRNATFFSVFHLASATKFFQGSSWYTEIDKQGNSPLHYAITNGREDSLEHILFTVIPKLSQKEIRNIFEALDEENRVPLALLIEKYPFFAQRVLDQHGVIRQPFFSAGQENSRVRVTYNTWLITPYKENEGSIHNKSIRTMGLFERKELTSHALTRYVVEQKWRVLKYVFFVEFLMQFFITCILSFSAIFSNERLNLSESFHELVFSGPVWLGLRYAMIGLSALNLIWRLYVPIRTLIGGKIPTQLGGVLFLLVTYVGLITYVFIDLPNPTASLSSSSAIGYAFFNLLLMIHLMEYLNLSSTVGPVVLGVANTFFPTISWFAFFAMVFIAYSVTLTAVASTYSPLDYSTTVYTMRTLFFGMFGQLDSLADIAASQDWLSITIYYTYLFAVPLLLFNILVGLVTGAYSEIEADKKNNWRLMRTKLIIDLEECLPTFLQKLNFPSRVEQVIEGVTQKSQKQTEEEGISKQLDAVMEKIQAQEKLLERFTFLQDALEGKHQATLEQVRALVSRRWTRWFFLSML